MAPQRLDQRDLAILGILQREGRITNQRLAERIHLSASACLERVKRLEQLGVVKGYGAEVALEKVLRCSTVYVEVTLKRHEAQDFDRFESAIRDIPEVLECNAIGGGSDYLMKVIALDIAHYQELIDRLLAADIGIGRYFTYVVTKPVKRAGPLPLQHLLHEAERREQHRQT